MTVTLRVLTINLWNIDGEPARRDLLRTGIAALGPDLIALQEVARSDEYDQLTDVLADTELFGVHQLDVLPVTPAGEQAGTALASRWRPERVEGFHLPQSHGPEGHACALAATIPLPGGLDVLFLSVKPSWRLDAEADRIRQVRAITDIDAEFRRPTPTILAGDFDATPDADCMRYLHGRAVLDGHSVHYHDAWTIAGDGGPGHTWTRENPLAAPVVDELVGQAPHARRIDHILVGSRHVHPDIAAYVRRCEVVLADPPASDHYGVLAEIEIASCR